MPRRRVSDPVRLHTERIARRTLKTADPILGVMGGMTKAEAREILRLSDKEFYSELKKTQNAPSGYRLPKGKRGAIIKSGKAAPYLAAVSKVPKCFSIAYDNRGRSFDQYTVFFRGESGGDGWDECWVRGMSNNPQHPQGFNQYIGDCEEFPDTYTPDAAITLGKVRDWDELPRKVQKAIADECSEVGY
tara:strand:+ start:163 stop:729 length:567 start_codon:yes stop_codon:yes gene_type:complete